MKAKVAQINALLRREMPGWQLASQQGLDSMVKLAELAREPTYDAKTVVLLVESNRTTEPGVQGIRKAVAFLLDDDNVRLEAVQG